MLYLLRIQNHLGEDYMEVEKDFRGRLYFTFYNDIDKKVTTQLVTSGYIDRHPNEFIFPHPDDRYTITSRDALYFANYIDYKGEDLNHNIKASISRSIGDISSDRFFLNLYVKFKHERHWFSVMDMIKKGYYYRADNLLYFGGVNNEYFVYVIEDVVKFDALVTKLSIKKG